mgnify:CR=1 FL=1
MNVLQRQMFKMPTTNEPMGGITSGLDEAEAVESTEALGGIASGIETLFANIDNAENPKEIMDAIRGDEASVEERRTELGQLVGKADADQTPESVLTMVQPLMTVIESTGGIASLDADEGEESPVAPNIDEANQAEAIARMMQNEPTAMLSVGTTPNINQKIAGMEALAKTPVGLLALSQMYAPKVTPLPDLQKQFLDRPSAYKEYAETLPGLTLAKFGQIIGRSPTLIGAALDPETAKLTDPFLQLSLLKAKEDASRLEKASDVFTKQTEASAKAKADLAKPIFTELAKSGFTFSKNDMGDIIAQNTRTGEVRVVQSGPGKIIQEGGFVGRITSDPGGGTSLKVIREAPNIGTFKDEASGKTYIYDTNQINSKGELTFQTVGGKSQAQLTAENVVIKEGPGGSIYFINKGTGSAIEKVKGRNETDIKQVPGVGLVLVDKTNKTTKVLEGTKGTNYKTYGTEKTGFVAVDFNSVDDQGNFKKVQLTDGVQPEVFQKIDKLNKAQATIRDPKVNRFSSQYKDAQTTLKVLSRELFNTSEFENVVQEKADILFGKYVKAGLSETDASALVDEFRNEAFTDFINKKSTVTTTYNPTEAMDKVYATSIEKFITKARTNAEANDKLANYAGIFKEGSKGFKTGTLAATRLSIGKFLNAVPTLRTKLEDAVGADNLQDFLGGKIATGETMNKIGAQFAIIFASNFPGNLNQSEVDLVKEAGPQLSTTADGIALMEKIFAQASKRSTDELQIIEKIMTDPKLKGLKPEDKYFKLTSAIDAYRKENKLVTREMIDTLKSATPSQEAGYFFATKGTNDDAGINFGPKQVARAQIIFKPDADTFENFITNYGDEFKALLQQQEPNKSYSDDAIKQFYNEYRKYDFKQRTVGSQ